MQYPFSCLPATYEGIEKTLSPSRLSKYLREAYGERHLALRLYIWIGRLCEAMYLPLQTAEVSIRNAVQIPITKRFGDNWYKDHRFVNLLPNRMKVELEETIKRETRKRGDRVTKDNIIANLNFGFWVGLMSKSYDKQLWINGVKQSFPNATENDNRESIHLKLNRMREFRNNMMHYHAIYDKNPHAQFMNLLYIVKLICAETHWLMTQVSTLSQTINSRPSH